MPPIRIVCLGLLLLGACADRGNDPLPFQPGPLPGRPGASVGDVAPAPGTDLRDRARVTQACREAADRVIVTRDRGQLLREDERDARVGSQASIFAQRAETDRLGRIFERDQLARQCVGENNRGEFTPAPGGAAAPR